MKKVVGFLVTLNLCVCGMTSLLLGMEDARDASVIDASKCSAESSCKIAQSVLAQEAALARLVHALNFSWVDEDTAQPHPRIAGMAQPFSGEHLQDLATIGVGVIVTLTEKPLPAEMVRPGLMAYVHLPVRDGETPSPEQVAFFIKIVHGAMSLGKSVAVHCKHGIVRTGFLLACWLVIGQGKTPREAMRIVKEFRGSMSVCPPRLAAQVTKHMEDQATTLDAQVAEVFSTLQLR